MRQAFEVRNGLSDAFRSNTALSTLRHFYINDTTFPVADFMEVQMRLQLKHHLQQEILDHSKQLHLSEALAFEHQYRVYLVGLLDNAASLLDSLTYPQQAYTRLVLTPQAARVFLEYLLTTGEIELPANLLSP